MCHQPSRVYPCRTILEIKAMIEQIEQSRATTTASIPPTNEKTIYDVTKERRGVTDEYIPEPLIFPKPARQRVPLL